MEAFHTQKEKKLPNQDAYTVSVQDPFQKDSKPVMLHSGESVRFTQPPSPDLYAFSSGAWFGLIIGILLLGYTPLRFKGQYRLKNQSISAAKLTFWRITGSSWFWSVLYAVGSAALYWEGPRTFLSGGLCGALFLCALEQAGLAWKERHKH